MTQGCKECEVMRVALEFVVDGYAHPDVNHVDYRVKVYQVALAALARAKCPCSPAPCIYPECTCSFTEGNRT